MRASGVAAMIRSTSPYTPRVTSTTLAAMKPQNSTSVRVDSVTPMMSKAGARQLATSAIDSSANSPRFRSMNTDVVARTGAPVSRARSTALTASPPTMVGRNRLKNMPMK